MSSTGHFQAAHGYFGEGASTPLNEPSRIERMLFAFLFLGFCLLFTGVEIDVPVLTLKPFDVVCLLAAPILVMGALVMHRKLPNSTGFLLITAFLLMNAVLAFKLGTKNGVRETIQAVQLIIFAALLAMYRPYLDWRTMAKWFLTIAALITIFNIYWHVSQGFLVGWKRLDEPKLLFSYAPPVIFALMLWHRRAGVGAYVLLGVFCVLLLLSGERKAQLALLIHLLILCAIGYTRVSVYLLGAAAVLPALAALILSDPYLQQQFTSVLDLGREQTYTLSEMVDERSGITQSNGQRMFALDVSKVLIAENPFFGVGTNGYQPIVRDAYPTLPWFYLLSIHNEFQRVLVENGFVGLSLFLLPWIRSLAFSVQIGRMFGTRTFAIYIMFYVVFFIQCFFEGSGNEAFLAFLMMGLLPEFFLAAQTPQGQNRPEETLREGFSR